MENISVLTKVDKKEQKFDARELFQKITAIYTFMDDIIVEREKRLHLPFECALPLSINGFRECFIKVVYRQGFKLDIEEISGRFPGVWGISKYIDFRFNQDDLWLSSLEPEDTERFYQIITDFRIYLMRLLSIQLATICDPDFFNNRESLPSLEDYFEIRTMVAKEFGDEFGKRYEEIISHLLFTINQYVVFLQESLLTV